MTADPEGFLYPKIDQEKCVDCGICLKKCPVLNVDSLKLSGHDTRIFAGYRTDTEQLLESASGGAASALAEAFIGSGGLVCGAVYKNNFRGVGFALADNAAGLKKFKSSKYIFSEMNEIYDRIQLSIREGNKVLFIGLPCEVSALKSYLGQDIDLLYTVELICYGVTSPIIAKQYLDSLESSHHSTINEFNVRYKKDGWTVPYLRAVFRNGRIIEKPFYETNYGLAFTQLSRPSCYNCHFKGERRAADMTIGDALGITEEDSCWNDNGVSLLLTHTNKGAELIDALTDFTLFPLDRNKALRDNERMETSPGEDPDRKRFSALWRERGLSGVCKIWRRS